MELTYTKVGDYYIPDLALDDDTEYKMPHLLEKSIDGFTLGRKLIQRLWSVNDAVFNWTSLCKTIPAWGATLRCAVNLLRFFCLGMASHSMQLKTASFTLHRR